jgi:UDP-N-acetylmuramate dehydrogenase
MAKRLDRACPGGVRANEPMARHTTIGVGGAARFFATPRTVREVAALVRAASDLGIAYIPIGNGSNLLVRDGGYDGLVIHIGRELSKLVLRVRTAQAEAGLSFTRLGKVLTREGRPGFEFAVGIPGSVGGAVRMNAGAWGHSLAGVLTSIRIVDETGKIVALAVDRLGLAYRRSALPGGAVVVSALFKAPPGKVDQALLERSMTRGATQPLSRRSFGSAFKNPPGDFAGRLIEECGLKGARRGGVEVSRKHANFLVNLGEDTRAADVEDLMDQIAEKVESRFKVRLIPEVIVIGNR